MNFQRMNFSRMLMLIACTTATLCGVVIAEDKPLMLGDAAPKIEVREFVKGEPVQQFEAGKTYVVEFWATWCGPCLASIPHLTELQKQNPTVVFLGISVDEDTGDVKTFVKEMGDKMDYRVAIDTRTKEVATGLMQKSWLAASFQDGIPVAFIVNKEGKLAWIGHPGELEEPLTQVVAGKWDLASETKKYAEIIALKKQAAALEVDFAAAVDAKKYQHGLELIETAVKANPALEPEWAIAKLWTLILLDQTEQAVTFGNHVVDELFSDQPTQLVLIAGMIVRPEEFAPFGQTSDQEDGDSKTKSKPADRAKEPTKEKAATKETAGKKEANHEADAKLVELAMRAAEQAAELTEGFPDITQQTTTIEVLAAAYAAGGQKDKAEKALQTELEILQEHAATTKAAIQMIQAQLKALDGNANEKPAKDKPDEKQKVDSSKKADEK